MKVTSSLLLLAAAATPAMAQTVDGSIVGDGYGAAVSVQGVQTMFGDNLSELDACYAQISGGRLFMALTGNIENNFNKICILIDSKAGGENVFSGTPGNDNSTTMTGMTFDAGFEADYFVIARRGSGKFDFDIAELGTPNFTSLFDVYGGVEEGSGTVPPGPANLSPIDVAYNNSNLAGIAGGTLAADMAAALLVETGFEMSIDLADLGNPTGDIKVMAFVSGSNLDYASNQFLGSLTAPQGNLGGDGTGAFTGTMIFDLNTFTGDQFFCIPTSTNLGTNYCMVTDNSTLAPALMSISGSLSINDGNFVMTASPVPNEPYVFFTGPNQIQAIFGDGFRCVGGTVVRIWPPGLASGNAATRSIDLAAFGISQGTWNFQCWFRDPGGAGSGFNLSDGSEVLVVL